MSRNSDRLGSQFEADAASQQQLAQNIENNDFSFIVPTEIIDLPSRGMLYPQGHPLHGKDPTKVDRSAAYISRYIAKNVVASGIADKCTLQLAYAIGVSEPLSIFIDTHGTSKILDDELIKKITANIDLTPRGIRDHLNLHKPIYKKSAAYGHFGRDAESDGSFSWEKLDLAEKL